MDFTAYTMEYAPLWTGEPGITCVPMEERYFPEYKAMYNACFYDMRYALGIQPYNVLESFEQLGDKLPDIRLLETGIRHAYRGIAIHMRSEWIQKATE